MDHLLVHRISLLAHAMGQAAFAVVGESKNDGAVQQTGFLQRVEHRHDVLVHDRMQVGIEVDVILASLRSVERCEFVIRVTRALLDFWFGREIVGVVAGQLDPEFGEVLAAVAGLNPGARLHPRPRIEADIVRVHQRDEHAEWFVELACPVFQELHHAFAAHTGGLSAWRGRIEPADVTSVIVGVSAAERAQPVEFAEWSALPFLDCIACVRRIPSGPAPILLHHLDIRRAPVFAAVPHRRISGVAQMPFALPEHFVTGFLLEQRGDIRQPVFMRQAGPQKGLGYAVHRRKATRLHQAA